MRVELPAGGFKPRNYQASFMSYMDDGEAGRKKRAILCWPRRSGKDLTALHQTAKLAVQRQGFYVYGLPTYNQARRVCWQGFLSDGRPLIEAVFPKPLVKSRRDSDMTLELANGSLIQFVGADTIDRLVGTNPVGVVLSEMALCRPTVFNLLRPILAQNDGWFVGQSTPRGQNHFYELFQRGKTDSGWFVSHRTIEQTNSMPMSAIEDEIRSGMPPSLVRQEFYCDFTAALVGSVWGDLLEALEKDGCMAAFEHETDAVFTSWDLGIGDATSIWFWVAKEDGVDVIDFYESSGKPLSHYLDELELRSRKMGYRYRKHFLPHDARAKTLQTGVSTIEQVVSRLGAGFVEITPQLSLADGIQAMRWLLQQNTYFHPRCGEGLQALKQYHYSYDEERKTFSSKPEHDWSSHAADAARYMALAYRFAESITRKPKPPPVLKPRGMTLNEMWEAQDRLNASRGSRER